MNDKQNIVKLLIGSVTDATARASVGVSRNKLVDIKKNGVKKTGEVTKNPIRKGETATSQTRTSKTL